MKVSRSYAYGSYPAIRLGDMHAVPVAGVYATFYINTLVQTRMWLSLPPSRTRSPRHFEEPAAPMNVASLVYTLAAPSEI